MKHKLESRFRRNINNLRYADAAAATAAAKLLQSCLTPCDPVDGSPSGSSVHGIFQARVLEWGAITKIMTCGPITSWQINGETMETVTDFIFLDSKITLNGDCNHEIKRHLPLERKAMTNLGRILKSRDNNLLIKIHLFRPMVFPVSYVDMRLGV